MTGLIIFIISTAILAWLIFGVKFKAKIKVRLPGNYKELLSENVAYYRLLSEADKLRFEEKVKDFLSYVKIHGVQSPVTDLDRLLVASSAVIPIFGFNNWRYTNLHDVLLYDSAFDRSDFSTEPDERDTLGMVGTGAMQQIMILSKHALRWGFRNEADKSNTGIHEFVHLLDKEDGDLDGIPASLLQRQYTIPWINLMNEGIHKIQRGESDINPYGATNKTEFFAVAAEYFFERPDLFKKNHPELFKLMEQIFRQEPVTIHKNIEL